MEKAKKTGLFGLLVLGALLLWQLCQQPEGVSQEKLIIRLIAEAEMALLDEIATRGKRFCEEEGTAEAVIGRVIGAVDFSTEVEVEVDSAGTQSGFFVRCDCGGTFSPLGREFSFSEVPDPFKHLTRIDRVATVEVGGYRYPALVLQGTSIVQPRKKFYTWLEWVHFSVFHGRLVPGCWWGHIRSWVYGTARREWTSIVVAIPLAKKGMFKKHRRQYLMVSNHCSDPRVGEWYDLEKALEEP